VNVDIDLLSLISIGGFFLGLLGLSILCLIGGFLVFTILIPFLLTNPTRRFLGRLGYKVVEKLAPIL
jgi:hypothetical protein